MICTLLPVDTLTDLRLTNKRWGDIATAVLWETFGTDFSDKKDRSLDALLESPPGGFLDHVKKLSIWKSRRDTDIYVANRLVQLVCALPRDSLREFTAEDKLDCRTLGLLIKNQTRLHKLSAFTLNGHVPSKSYLANNLEHLTRLTIYPNADDDEYGEWYRHTSRLRHLIIQKPPSSIARIPLKACTTTPHRVLLDLQSLRLQGFRLPSTPRPLGPWLKLSSLQDLTLTDCSSEGTFLGELAEELFGLNKSSLRSLSVVQPDRALLWDTHLGVVLKSTPRLETLYISSQSGNYVEIKDLAPVGTSLRYLLIEPLANLNIDVEGDEARIYLVQELEELVTTCPNLEELGLSLVHINTRQWHALDPIDVFPSSARTEKGEQLAKALDIIATFPKLRVLRLTHPPFNAPWNESNAAVTSREHQWHHTQVANEIFRYLDEKQSSVEILAFSPTIIKASAAYALVDENGHLWPNYYYVKGEMSVTSWRGRVVSKVVAIPVSIKELLDYVLQPKILFCQETPHAY